MALKEYKPERLQRIAGAIIADAGRGKTTLAKTLVANGGKVCLLAAEPGALVVRDEIQSGAIKAYEMTTLQDFKDAYTHLKENKEGFTDIYIDSLTEISDRILKELSDKYKDGRQLFGEFGKQMLELIKAFRDMPTASVWFTVLTSTEVDDLNRRFVGPNIAGKSTKERFVSLFDEVLYIDMQRDPETQEEKRVIITGNYRTYPGKDRSGKLELFEAPDLGAIKAKVLAN